MKYFFSPYEIRGEKGALLKVQEGNLWGLSDLFPLKGLKDEPLEYHISQRNTQLWKRSCYFAGLDLDAKKRGVSLSQSLTLPPSHELITNLQSLPKHPVLKIKVGDHPQAETDWLIRHVAGSSLKVRLDFNLKLSRGAFFKYLELLYPIRSNLEFIEDPYPFDPDQWEQDQHDEELTFALDFQSERGVGMPKAAPLLILKPMRQDEKPFEKAVKQGQRVVVTSCRDHDIGQWIAAFIAQKFPKEITGIFSEGSPQEIPKGLGFGFDEILKEKSWYPC